MRRARAILGARDMLWASGLLILVRELGMATKGAPALFIDEKSTCFFHQNELG